MSAWLKPSSSSSSSSSLRNLPQLVLPSSSESERGEEEEEEEGEGRGVKEEEEGEVVGEDEEECGEGGCPVSPSVSSRAPEFALLSSEEGVVLVVWSMAEADWSIGDADVWSPPGGRFPW